jgi:hypothetical protein
MSEALRIQPKEAREKILAGKAMLVCAYDNDEKFKKVNLEGAISLSELRVKEESLSKEQEIIFYCA